MNLATQGVKGEGLAGVDVLHGVPPKRERDRERCANRQAPRSRIICATEGFVTYKWKMQETDAVYPPCAPLAGESSAWELGKGAILFLRQGKRNENVPIVSVTDRPSLLNPLRKNMLKRL